MTNALNRIARAGRPRFARLLVATITLCAVACGDGSDSDPGPPVEDILQEALGSIGRFEPVQLDTRALARAVQAGQMVRLPFALEESGLVEREVQLTLRNMRAPELGEFVLKDGIKNEGRTSALPPPATYQGIVVAHPGEQRGVAVLTITASVVEGNLLAAPDGWSLIEPLEPLLRLRNVDPAQRRRVLRKYNHIVYNARDSRILQERPDALAAFTRRPRATRSTVVGGATATPLVLSIVGDGDAEFARAYPTDSVMPFWLKEEGLFNAIDWLYNCVEPDANADNDYAECANAFDGGSDGFQARLRIDRLEVWTAGGPQSPNRQGVLEESARLTHQANPVCCGEPHTAGRANLVHFFSGKSFPEGAGVAAIAGLNVYGDSCLGQAANFCCHHAVSQLVPDNFFPGTLLHQQLLVAHEIGHNNGGAEDTTPMHQEWLYNTQSGTTLMHSAFGFTPSSIYVYDRMDATDVIGPLLHSRLTDPSNTTVPCSGEPIGSGN